MKKEKTEREVEELSASGVKKYMECEKKFWYNYLSSIGFPEREEPFHFRIGNTVHESIENVLQTDWKERISDGDGLDEERLFELLVEEGNKLDYEYDDDEKVNQCFETASRWIPSFVESVNHVEDEWSMERDGLDYKGFADLVADIEFNGETFENVIVDWKTGSVNDEWKEKIQAGMYIEMFYDSFGHYPEGAVFVYLNEETQSMHRRIQDGKVVWNEHENKYWNEIENQKNNILRSEALDEWEAKPEQSRCYFCDFKYHCRDSGIGAEDVQVHQFNPDTQV